MSFNDWMPMDMDADRERIVVGATYPTGYVRRQIRGWPVSVWLRGRMWRVESALLPPVTFATSYAAIQYAEIELQRSHRP